ncbi:MAG: hypothetical protein AABY22_05760 [Nanoarchaeota archaeon]
MDINQNPNEFKIKLAFDLLTPEEINQLNFRVTKTISELNKKEILAVGKTFGLKIGMSFEDNDPKKYVYYQLGVTIVDKPNETQDNCFYNFFIEDIDVYDFDTKADWFDKVADTKQEKNGVENVFYEDQFFQTIQNKDYDPDKILADNPELEKMVDTLVQELIAPPCSTNIVYESPSIQEEQKKEKEEPTTISKEELFDFHDPEQVFYTPTEYVDMINSHALYVLSQSFESYLNHRKMPSDEINQINFEAIKNLQWKISRCDFTVFTKSELLKIGFTNWQNKYMLIPLWLLPLIIKNHEGMILFDVRSKKEIEIGKFDFKFHSIRFGSSSYAFPVEHIKFKE